MKKSILYLICILFLIAVLVGLIVNKETKRTGFNRKLRPVGLVVTQQFRIPNTTFGFLGKADHMIHLNVYRDPMHLYQIDSALSKLQKLALGYPENFNEKATNLYKDMQGDRTYITNSYGDIFVFGGKEKRFTTIKDFRFENIKAVSPATLIVRSRIDKNGRLNRSVSKLSIGGKTVVEKTFVLPDVDNGFFKNDGMLYYDPSSSTVLYTYFYKGAFIALDTNLKLKYEVRTVDTLTHPDIQVKEFTRTIKGAEVLKGITQTSTPPIVNAYFSVHKGHIYILSRRQAGNEQDVTFKENQVVDVYLVQNGAYLHSFYIPKFKGLKIYQFQWIDGGIICIYKDYLLKYKLY